MNYSAYTTTRNTKEERDKAGAHTAATHLPPPILTTSTPTTAWIATARSKPFSFGVKKNCETCSVVSVLNTDKAEHVWKFLSRKESSVDLAAGCMLL